MAPKEIGMVEVDGHCLLESTIGAVEAEAIAASYHLAPHCKVVSPLSIPDRSALMHNPPSSYLTVPVYALRAGLSFPLSRDHRAIFRFIGLPICQLSMNSIYLINAFIVVWRWFKWGKLVEDFSHMIKINSPRRGKWEFNLSFKAHSFLLTPSNSHPGLRSKFVWVKCPGEIPWTPKNRWVDPLRTQITIESETGPAISAGDTAKIAYVKFKADALSARNIMKAAGLIYPFDHKWSHEEKLRRRSYLGKQMAFRLAGMAAEEDLRSGKFEKTTTTDLQVEIITECNLLDARFPPSEEVFDARFDDPAFEGVDEGEDDPMVEEAAKELDAELKKSAIEARKKSNAEGKKKSTTTSKRKSTVDLGRKSTRGPKEPKLMADAIRSAPEISPSVFTAPTSSKKATALGGRREKTRVEGEEEVLNVQPLVSLTPQGQMVVNLPSTDSEATAPERVEPPKHSFDEVTSPTPPVDNVEVETKSTPQVDVNMDVEAETKSTSPVEVTMAVEVDLEKAPEVDSEAIQPPTVENVITLEDETSPSKHRDEGKTPTVEVETTNPWVRVTEESGGRSFGGDVDPSEGEYSFDLGPALESFAGDVFNILTESARKRVNDRVNVLEDQLDIVADRIREEERQKAERAAILSAMRITNLEHELNQLREKYDSEVRERAILTLENADLESAFQKANEGFRLSKEELDLASKTVLAYSSRIDGLTSEKAELTSEKAKLLAEKEEFLAEKAEFMAEKAAMSLEIEKKDVVSRDLSKDLAEARQSLNDAEALRNSEVEKSQLLRGEVNSLTSEVDRLKGEVARVESEAEVIRKTARIEGVRDFRESRVFKNLVATLAGRVGIILRSNAIFQAQRLGGFKPDFDPSKYLKPLMDKNFQEYVEDDSVVFSPSDEFAEFAFDRRRDHGLIPPETVQGAPQVPQYPPPKPKET